MPNCAVACASVSPDMTSRRGIIAPLSARSAVESSRMPHSGSDSRHSSRRSAA